MKKFFLLGFALSLLFASKSTATAPTIAAIVPSAGNVGSLSQITVRFNEPVAGVDAADFLINGLPATNVSGSGTNYTFTFVPPRDGTVFIAWEGSHGIVDFENPPKPFDSYGPGATWQYTLTDTVAPTVVQVSPAAGATVRSWGNVAVTFSEAVWGIDAADFRLNGVAATTVTGTGSGPYEFEFSPPANGLVTATWAGGHGIRDFAGTPNLFAGGSWTYTLNTNAVFEGQVVINEIMYHPASERLDQEWIELRNRGSNAVNLTGWRLDRAVSFVFPNTNLPGGYLVAAANLAAFRAQYPAVANVVGGWNGRLSNSRDEIELEDASGNRVDVVAYADEGDWAVRTQLPSVRWEWLSGSDGLGRSMELRQGALENNTGQNWLPSTTQNGTPGAANSVGSANIPPMILEVTHLPAIPRSTNAITVLARIVDESASGLAVRLWYRDANTLPAFTSVNMLDNGASNDGTMGDGLYGVVLPAMANGSIIEFYIEAVDSGSSSRTWPAAADLGGGNFAQEANAFFQVDDENYTGRQPIYRIIMRPSDRNELFNFADRIQRNATFISVEGSDVQVRHRCTVRRRGASSFGANPPTMKFNIPSETPWNEKTSMNLNSDTTYAQVMGSQVALKAGLPVGDARAVQLRINARNESDSGSRQFGSYAHVEVLDGEWARDHFPADGNGNVYSKRRAGSFDCDERLLYLGPNFQGYANCGYAKESNASENDWADLSSMLFALDDATTPDNEYVQAVRRNINVDLWLRYFAVLVLMTYNETALGSVANDDYGLYRGVVDPRFMILTHDLDTVFGIGSGGPNGIFRATETDNVDRFLFHPEFQALYFDEFRRQMAGAFSTNNLYPLFDQFLSGWVPAPTINNMKASVLSQINSVIASLPPAPVVVRATISGEPPSPTYLNSATLTVGGAGITHYRYRLNGSAFGLETPVATPITLSSLANGTYTVHVIGRDGSGTWQSEASATISRSWTVLSNLRSVLINEVLARNDSAVNHNGTFPDLIELFNATATSADLAGLRVTDDLNEPNKFVFAPGTVLAAGGYLVLYAGNADGTPGIHLGFTLNQSGETLYLLDRATNGGRVIDSVEFGLQLPNLSVGRLLNGHWGLSNPTFGSVNTLAATGNRTAVKINEWLASGAAPFLDDFIELYNPEALPVALGGLFLTDEPGGLPLRHRITPLSFIAGFGYRAFIADANETAGADHLNFQLALELGEIALKTAEAATIDCVVYGQQFAGISQGRAPNGGPRIVFLDLPTPGAGNPVPLEPVPPQTIVLVPIEQNWKYDDTGTALGTNWIAPTYNDAAWPSGPGLLVAPRGGDALPEPIRTVLMSAIGKSAMYFRTRFNYDTNVNASEVRLYHIVDDGAVFYLNGVELFRHNMPAGPIQYSTLAPANVLDASYVGPVIVPLSSLRQGQNLLTVEAHNRSVDSPDIAFGLRLEAVILTNNPSLAGIVFNEVLANARSVTNADGTATDWVELYNPSAASVDLAGMSLTDDPVNLPRRWVFPPGSVVAAQGYFTVRFDPNVPATTNAAVVLNTGFGLNASRDEVYLYDRPQDGGSQVDAITFGLQAPDWSIGRVPNGGSNWVLTLPTAGALNIAAQLGDVRRLKVNEWMAAPASGDDWFELYNPNAQPVDLSGLHFTDDLLDLFKSPMQARSFIAGGLLGFQKFEADENPGAGADHVDFRLSSSHDLIRLSDAVGNQIHQVTFGQQQIGVSGGSLPDGATNIQVFPGTATPGESNYRPIPSIVISEVLTHSDFPLEDAIELRNLSPSLVNISGWYLSDARTFLNKFRIPDNTSIPANGHIVFYEYQFNPRPGDPDSFALSSAQGDQLYLSAAAAGVLTGFRAVADFGAGERGVSFGRFNTSIGTEFVALGARTFGVDTPDNVEQFRLGMGGTNSYPKIGPVVISEFSYHPPDLGGNDNLVDEYIQLRNITSNPVTLFDPDYPTNRWRLRDAVKFDFPPHTIPPNETLLIVSFDPATNAAALAAFRFTYGLPANTAIFGPYEGKLDNSSDSLELYKPDVPQPAGTPDAGFVPYVLVERITYSDTSPWPLAADGSGAALNRVNINLFGNDPVNWQAGTPLSGPVDRDGDGMPDSWEEQYNLDPDNPADAAADNDNDGLTNRQEYLAGTDPTNRASNLDLRIVVISPVTLQFTAAPNKSYTIEYRNDLTFGSWVPLTHVDPAPNLRTVQVPDAPSVTKRFYRLRVP